MAQRKPNRKPFRPRVIGGGASAVRLLTMPIGGGAVAKLYVPTTLSDAQEINLARSLALAARELYEKHPTATEVM